MSLVSAVTLVWSVQEPVFAYKLCLLRIGSTNEINILPQPGGAFVSSLGDLAALLNCIVAVVLE